MSKKFMRVGTLVRSGFRSPWYGVVVVSAADHDLTNVGHVPRVVYENKIVFLSHEHIVLVKVTHDHAAKPLRKPIYRQLHSRWLNEVEKIP